MAEISMNQLNVLEIGPSTREGRLWDVCMPPGRKVQTRTSADVLRDASDDSGCWGRVQPPTNQKSLSVEASARTFGDAPQGCAQDGLDQVPVDRP